MSDIIYHVGSRLSPESAFGLYHHFVLPVALKFHSTIIYSRQWFTYKDEQLYPVIVNPPFEISFLGKQTVLLLRSPELTMRHQALLAAGAKHEHSVFKLYIRLGKMQDVQIKPPPTFPLVFDKEYYGTWKE